MTLSAQPTPGAPGCGAQRIRFGPVAVLGLWASARPASLLIALIGVGLALRIPLLFERDIWLDEVVQHYISVGPISEVTPRLVACDRNPPGYAALCWLALRATDEPMVMRVVSLFFGLVTIPLGWSVGRALGDRCSAPVLAALIAVSPAYAAYSREARPYALGLALVTVFLLTTVRMLRSPSPRRALFAGAAAGAVAMTQYAGAAVVGVVIGAAAAWAILERSERRARVVAVSIVAAAFAAAAATTYFVYAGPQLSTSGSGGGFLKDEFYNIRDVRAAARFAPVKTGELLAFTVMGRTPPGPRWELLAGGAVGAALLAAVLAAVRDRTRALVVGSAAAATAVFVLLAGVGLHPFGPIRHCLPLAPLITATLAIGVCHLRAAPGLLRPLLGEGVMAALIGLALAGAADRMGRDGYRIHDLLIALSARLAPGDTVACEGGGGCVATVFSLSNDSAEAMRVERDGSAPAGTDFRTDAFPVAIRMLAAYEPERVVEQLATLEVPVGKRIWIIGRSTGPFEPGTPVRPFARVDEIVFPGCRATCWQRVAGD